MEETMVGSPIEGTATTQADAAIATGPAPLTMAEVFAKPEPATTQGKAQTTQPQAKAQEQPTQQTATAPAQQQQPQQRTQADLDRAFSERTKAAENKGFTKAQQTDEFSLGKMFIESEMLAKGLSRDDAIKSIRENAKKQRSERFKANPDEMFDAIANLVQGNQPQAQRTQTQVPESVTNLNPQFNDAFVNNVSRGIAEAQANGTIPANFMDYGLSPAFFDRAAKYSVAAAIEMAMIENKPSAQAEAVAKRVEQRKADPKPIQASGESAQPGPYNFKTMKQDQWDANYKAVKEALAEGRQVDWGR